jgi:hypothetical protein
MEFVTNLLTFTGGLLTISVVCSVVGGYWKTKRAGQSFSEKDFCQWLGIGAVVALFPMFAFGVSYLFDLTMVWPVAFFYGGILYVANWISALTGVPPLLFALLILLAPALLSGIISCCAKRRRRPSNNS